MKLEIDDKFLLLKELNKNELNIIKKHFTFSDMGRVFMGGSFNSRNIKKVCFLKKGTVGVYFLFSGFLHKLLLLIKENNFNIEIKDKRNKIPDVNILEYLPDFQYNEHQKEALERMKKVNTGIIFSPTSSGKSEVFISYIKAMNIPTLVLVNRINLAQQIRERFGEGMGICTGNKYIEDTHMVSTIGSVKKINNIERFKILIVDECHRAVSKTYQDFFLVNNFSFKYGFSATPFENDKYKNALVEQYLGSVIFSIDINKLIEKEVIVKPKIFFEEIECHKTIDWPSANIKCIVENEERNNKIKELTEKDNKQTLILIRNIEHGKKLNEMIEGSVFVSGIDNTNYRNEIIKKFEDGEINTIISSNIFNEGISINSIKKLIIASGGKSKIENTQKLGRGLRRSPGKTFVEVYDFYDKGNRFTELHSKIRKDIYKKVGFKVN